MQRKGVQVPTEGNWLNPRIHWYNAPHQWQSMGADGKIT